MKNIRVFVSENFQFLEVKFSIYLNRRVFVMPLTYIHTYIHTHMINLIFYWNSDVILAHAQIDDYEFT